MRKNKAETKSTKSRKKEKNAEKGSTDSFLSTFSSKKRTKKDSLRSEMDRIFDIMCAKGCRKPRQNNNPASEGASRKKTQTKSKNRDEWTDFIEAYSRILWKLRKQDLEMQPTKPSFVHPPPSCDVFPSRPDSWNNAKSKKLRIRVHTDASLVSECRLWAGPSTSSPSFLFDESISDEQRNCLQFHNSLSYGNIEGRCPEDYVCKLREEEFDKQARLRPKSTNMGMKTRNGERLELEDMFTKEGWEILRNPEDSPDELKGKRRRVNEEERNTTEKLEEDGSEILRTPVRNLSNEPGAKRIKLDEDEVSPVEELVETASPLPEFETFSPLKPESTVDEQVNSIEVEKVVAEKPVLERKNGVLKTLQLEEGCSTAHPIDINYNSETVISHSYSENVDVSAIDGDAVYPATIKIEPARLSIVCEEKGKQEAEVVTNELNTHSPVVDNKKEPGINCDSKVKDVREPTAEPERKTPSYPNRGCPFRFRRSGSAPCWLISGEIDRVACRLGKVEERTPYRNDDSDTDEDNDVDVVSMKNSGQRTVRRDGIRGKTEVLDGSGEVDASNTYDEESVSDEQEVFIIESDSEDGGPLEKDCLFGEEQVDDVLAASRPSSDRSLQFCPESSFIRLPDSVMGLSSGCGNKYYSGTFLKSTDQASVYIAQPATRSLVAVKNGGGSGIQSEE